MLVIYIKWAGMFKYANIQLLPYGSGTKAVITHKQDSFTLKQKRFHQKQFILGSGNLGEGGCLEGSSSPEEEHPPTIASRSLSIAWKDGH